MTIEMARWRYYFLMNLSSKSSLWNLLFWKNEKKIEILIPDAHNNFTFRFFSSNESGD